MNQVQKNVIANFMGSFWAALMSVAFVPVYISYLGMEAYGLIGVFIFLQGWLVLMDLGLTQALSREMARYIGGEHTASSIRNLLFSVECVFCVLASIFICCLTIFAPWIASNFLNVETLELQNVVQSLRIIGVVVALRGVLGLYRGAVMGLEEQVRLNLLAGIFATIRGLGVIFAMYWIDATTTVFFTFQCVVYFLEVLCLGFWLKIRIPYQGRVIFSIQELLKIWRFAGGVFLIMALSLVLIQVDKLLLSYLLPLAEFGRYTLAVTVATALYQLVNPVSGAASPRLIALVAGGNLAGLKDFYHKYMKMLVLMLAPAGFILIFFSEHILVLWTRDISLAAEVSPILSIYASGVVFNGLMFMPNLLQLAGGHTRLMIRIGIISVLAFVPAICLVAPQYGATGASVVWLILNLGYVFLTIPRMHKPLLSEEWKVWYIKDVLPVLVVAAVTACLMKQVIPFPDPDNRIPGIFGVLLAALVTVSLSVLVCLIIMIYFSGPKIVAMIQGGLGNQLFCYAATRALAIRNNLPLYLDTSTGFLRDLTYRREYSLHKFHVMGIPWINPVKSVHFNRLILATVARFNRLLPLRLRFYYRQNEIDYDHRFSKLKVSHLVYIEGYWQSEGYFSDCSDDIRKDLQFIGPVDLENHNMAHQMQSLLSVSLHVRWFDQPEVKNGHNISDEYYAKAVRHMEKTLNSPHYFVFSDNPIQASTKILLPTSRVTFVTINNDSSYAHKDLWLMSQCKHNIIANSTFSWWGAWLNSNPNKIVVAPNVTLEGKMAWGFEGLLPEEWHKV